MNKKYYDGGIVTEILLTHLEAEKMLEVLTAFAEAKGVDAVEVVRCKDCKHYGSGYFAGCPVRNVKSPNDFCAWAERKEE